MSELVKKAVEIGLATYKRSFFKRKRHRDVCVKDAVVSAVNLALEAAAEIFDRRHRDTMTALGRDPDKYMSKDSQDAAAIRAMKGERK